LVGKIKKIINKIIESIYKIIKKWIFIIIVIYNLANKDFIILYHAIIKINLDNNYLFLWKIINEINNNILLYNIMIKIRYKKSIYLLNIETKIFNRNINYWI